MLKQTDHLAEPAGGISRSWTFWAEDRSSWCDAGLCRGNMFTYTH